MTPPYPVDDAAVHHVFEGGWVWVLRFNNGVTSAGVAATQDVAQELALSEGEAAWQRLLDRLPALRAQFEAGGGLPAVPAHAGDQLSQPYHRGRAMGDVALSGRFC